MKQIRIFPIFVLLTFFLFGMLFSSASADSSDSEAVFASAATSSESAESLPGEKANKKYAVLVGVDDYEDTNLGKLQYTVPDIEIIYEQLLSIGFERENIFMLKSRSAAASKPTRKLINDKIDRVFDLAGPDDIVFLAFSGHGTQIDETIYFCAEDTYITDKETTQNTAVSISEVINRFDRSPARLKWLVIDACRYDPFSRSAEIPGSRSIQNLDDPPRGTVVMQSCGFGERSYEDDEVKHGLFTLSFVEALKGAADFNDNGQITLAEINEYTTNRTVEMAREKFHQSQRPYQSGDQSNFIIVKGLLKRGLKREVWTEADACFGRARQYRKDRNYKSARSEIEQALKLTEKADPPTCDERQRYLDESEIIEQLAEAMGISEGPGPRVSSLGVGTSAGEKKTRRVKGVDFTFCWCPPGEFTMGSPESEKGRSDGEQQHRVRLTKGFWLLESEVTQEMWKSVMGNGADDRLEEGYGKGSHFPMYGVDWNESQEFCRKLSELTGEKITLPTEAQWEYACRAGTKGSYGGTGKLDEMGWYDDNSGDKTHEVKGKQPNKWGLYDMHGNVWEWCSDWYGDYPSGSVTDPTGPSSGSDRVFRGGSWYNIAGSCRSAYRINGGPTIRYIYLGLRPSVVPAD